MTWLERCHGNHSLGRLEYVVGGCCMPCVRGDLSLGLVIIIVLEAEKLFYLAEK